MSLWTLRKDDGVFTGHALHVIPSLQDGDDVSSFPVVQNLALKPRGVDDAQQSTASLGVQAAEVFVGGTSSSLAARGVQ